MIRKAALLLLGMALVVSTVYADPAQRMTGGGSLVKGVTAAFSLTCDGSGSNNFVLRSDNGHFRMDTITSASCTADAYGNNVLIGGGTGTLNGEPGATVTYTLTDAAKGNNLNVNIVLGLDSFGIQSYLNGIQFHNP